MPAQPDDMSTRRIVYIVPGMDPERRTQDGCLQAGGAAYAPRPAIIFVHGGPVARGSGQKDRGVFRSYGELTAASGFIGITFNYRYYAAPLFAGRVPAR